MDRINDKINDLERSLNELFGFFPKNIRDYKDNLRDKAASERYFEKIIENIIELAILIIKEKDLETPEDEDNCIKILSKNNLIPENLADKLIEAKGMRNIIVHQYGEIDDEIVFDAINKELKTDVEEFLKLTKKI